LKPKPILLTLASLAIVTLSVSTIVQAADRENTTLPEGTGITTECQTPATKLASFSGSSSISEPGNKVKELNLVFLHGMGGTPCALQLVSDFIKERLPVYISQYEQDNPDVSVRVNTLIRCYPGFANIGTWALNIADSINEHFQGKDNIILVGHSMGGKTALYATAKNVGGLGDKVAAVVTINSPIKDLQRYHPPGGGSVEDYCRTVVLGSDEGVCDSVSHYDSSSDGEYVSKNKNWLAFISAEEAPLSRQFDRAGVDTWPRDMDDGTVPLSAQFSEDADIVYYGEWGHSDLAELDEPAEFIADRIVRYIFGYPIDVSLPARNGSLEHKADWVLGTDYWTDIVGAIASDSGIINFTNDSFFKWQETEHTVGYCLEGEERSYAHIRLLSLPLLTSISQSQWLVSDNTGDCRLYVRSRTAPRTTTRIDWTIYKRGLLPETNERAFYDICITEGTPLTSIPFVSWMDKNPHDSRLLVWSTAQSPFRWFKAEWRTYRKESLQKAIIDSVEERISSTSD
jgi:pimeloyl-ACP methyl ester carboxylesterase